MIFVLSNILYLQVIIASDSNTWFIDVLLRHFGIDDVIDDVNSNPAHWNGDLLEISRQVEPTT